MFEMFELTVDINLFPPTKSSKTIFVHTIRRPCGLSSVRIKITVTIFTLSGSAGALGLGEAFENGVGPLMEGGKLKRLEGVDGQTGKQKEGE